MTLVELVVVVGLIGVMFGVVFLRLDTLLPTSRLKSSARKLGSHVEQAFNHAVVSGRQIRFEYDIGAGAYRFFFPFELEEDGITIKGEGETPLLDWEYLADTIRIQDVRLGEGDLITSGQVFVTFEPRGIATGHVVHLTKEGSESFYSVLVSPLLGYVDVASGYVDTDVLEDENAF
ncbi:MAG: hypothetical protein HY812_01065 [Planctomycetes bacterium]|nr:hypothetical protein [Planctomycetota bacterium]